MSRGYSLPSTYLDLVDFEPRERWEAWRTFNAGLYEVEANVPDLAKMSAQSSSFDVGTAIFGRYTHDSTIFHRNPANSATQCEERVILLINYTGETKSIMSGRNVAISPQRFTLFDFNQDLDFKSNYTPATELTRRFEVRSACIP